MVRKQHRKKQVHVLVRGIMALRRLGVVRGLREGGTVQYCQPIGIKPLWRRRTLCTCEEDQSPVRDSNTKNE